MKHSTAGHCTAQTGSFACLFDCSLLARPLRFGPQRVGSPCSVVSLAQSTPLYLPNRSDVRRLCPLQIILAWPGRLARTARRA